MLPDRTTILIVGAGPVGLAAAAALIHQGCRDVVIVDAVDERLSSSRALTIHAATLEALDIIGCAESLTAIGNEGTFSRVYNQDGQVFGMDYTSLTGHTRFPYALLLSQYSTERTLETNLEKMGLKVQRPYKLVQLNDGGDEGLIATFETGETIKATYVIGADGARSTVRQLTNIGFADPNGKGNEEEDTVQMVAADLTFKSAPSLPRDSAHVYTSSGKVFIAIPLPKSPWPESYDHLNDDILRVGFVVPKEDGPPPHSPPPEYVQKYLDKLEWEPLQSTNKTHPVEIDQVLWSSRFRLRAAVADKFYVRFHTPGQEGPCRAVFLIGDAAHIHSPTGGQGMNLGIRDAISLAPVLKKHMELFAQDPRTADNIMEEHAAWRRARALYTIGLTKRTASFIWFLGSTGWAKYLVPVVKLILRIPFFSNRIVYSASGLGNR